MREKGKSMESIQQMRERHGREVDQLQMSCSHENSRRMPFMWAPGHFSSDVEVCDWCGKILKGYTGEESIVLTKEE